MLEPNRASIRAQAFEQLLRDRRLPHGAFRLFHFLLQYADADGICWPGRRLMKKTIGGDFTFLQKWIEGLKDTGWLRTEDFSAEKHPFVKERDKSMRDGMIYWLLNGDKANPQPFGKVGTLVAPTVRESRNAKCGKVGTPGVRESRNETYSIKPIPVSEGEGNQPPVSFGAKGGNKKREMWQLIADRKKTEDAINREKENTNSDPEILSALRAELKTTKDEIRALGKSNAPGEDAPPRPPSPNNRNTGTYNDPQKYPKERIDLEEINRRRARRQVADRNAGTLNDPNDYAGVTSVGGLESDSPSPAQPEAAQPMTDEQVQRAVAELRNWRKQK